jgi:putative transposase
MEESSMKYRRIKVPAGCFFFTVALQDRSSRLLIDHVDLLRISMRRVKQTHPYRVDAIVVLPDHLHAIWTLPEGDDDYSTRWSLIKAGFSRNIPRREYRNSSRKARRERGIWQRRFWEHQLREEEDYTRHMDYIHFNPVKHGYVGKASDWQYSSIHQAIARGDMAEDWGGCADLQLIGGEP